MFFATSHGKGAVDGIGGRSKSLIRNASKCQGEKGITVQSSIDFAAHIMRLMPGVKVLHVSEFEVKEMIEERKPWDDVLEMPGILSAHVMECSGQKVRLYKENKKSHEVCTIDYATESEDDELVDEATDDVNVGDWVIVMYDGKMYPGRVTAISEMGSKKVSVMRSAFPSGWKWPVEVNEIYYEDENIKKKISPPTPVNSRNKWQFDEPCLMK